MVTSQEAAEVKAIAIKAKSGADYDFSKLTPEAAERLDALSASINAKVGYSLPSTLGTKPIKETSDSVNAQLASAAQSLRTRGDAAK